MLCTKRAHQCTIFILLGALMKFYPFPHAIFEIARSVFIQILHHCSVSWKISTLYFLAQISYSLDRNSPSKCNFWTFEWLGENSPNSSCHIWDHLKSAFLTLHRSSMLWEISLFFSWNFIWFLQKEHTKVQNFRLSTAQLRFHQICTFIGYFCWKYIKFQLKRYGGFMSNDNKECCKIWRKTDFLFQKWQEFSEFWSEH